MKCKKKIPFYKYQQGIQIKYLTSLFNIHKVLLVNIYLDYAQLQTF